MENGVCCGFQENTGGLVDYAEALFVGWVELAKPMRPR
jgi:hypothetical protein